MAGQYELASFAHGLTTTANGSYIIEHTGDDVFEFTPTLPFGFLDFFVAKKTTPASGTITVDGMQRNWIGRDMGPKGIWYLVRGIGDENRGQFWSALADAPTTLKYNFNGAA